MNFLDSRLPPNFWVKVIPEPNSGCWLWLAAVDWDGYGQFWDKEKRLNKRSHRFAYEVEFGEIPDGLQIDHLCRTRNCCNPLHLEAVTPKVNTLRGESIQAKNAQKTHCVKGHEFTEDNLLVCKLPFRVCRTCHNARNIPYVRLDDRTEEAREKQRAADRRQYLRKKERKRSLGPRKATDHR